MEKTLWDETSIGTMKCKNRFWKAAFYERMSTKEGHVTPELVEYYRKQAEGGVGTIQLGYARVMEHDRPNPYMTSVYDDEFISGLRQIADAVHEHGASVVMQIAYGGSRTGVRDDGRLFWGPSAVANEGTGIVPTEMTAEDIATLVQAFADAALRCKQAGMDGVVVHAAHGYLLSSWLCPHYNQRSDQYGGSIQNRARVLVEVIVAIQEKCGQDYPVFIKYNSQDYMPDGLTEEDSLVLAKILEEAGCAALEVSGGNDCNADVAAADLGPIRRKLVNHPERCSYFADYARKLRKTVDIPIILTGGNRYFGMMDDLLKEGVCDYFGLARPLNSQPDLIKVWREDPEAKTRCVSCNKCFVTVGHECVLNPTAEFLVRRKK